MAFVTRSDRDFNYTAISQRTRLGPGQYYTKNPKETEEESKKIRLSNLKYSQIVKNTPQDKAIPFNSTEVRKFHYNNLDTPSPGDYDTNKIEKKSFLKIFDKNDIIEKEKKILSDYSLKRQNSDKIGFLTSQKRFKSDNLDSKNNSNNFDNMSNNIKTAPVSKKKKNYFKQKNKPKLFSKRPGSIDIISSIPNNKENYDAKIVGPGLYNLYPKWKKGAVDWKLSLKTEANFETRTLNELKELSEKEDLNPYSAKIKYFTNKNHNNNSSYYNSAYASLTKSDNNSKAKTEISTINTTPDSTYNSKCLKNIFINDDKKNPRVKIFHNFIERKKKIHSNKLKEIENPLCDLQTQFKNRDPLAPGYYNPMLLDKHKDMHNEKFQNFGSYSPKLPSPKDNPELGPGTYFNLDNNKRSVNTDKSKVIVGFVSPKTEEVGFMVDILRKVKDNNLGPGEFNLSKNFINKGVSNVNAFGSISERFDYRKHKKKGKSQENTFSNQELNKYIIAETDKSNPKNGKTASLFGNALHKKNKVYDIDKEEEEYQKQKEIEKRKRIINRHSPSVGDYDPDIINSISYRITSKINPYSYRNAPFNSVRSRMVGECLINRKTMGPGCYESGEAYNKLYENQRKYNVFGAIGKSVNGSMDAHVPGVGEYNVDGQIPWNKKTYNLLFINNKEK